MDLVMKVAMDAEICFTLSGLQGSFLNPSSVVHWLATATATPASSSPPLTWREMHEVLLHVLGVTRQI